MSKDSQEVKKNIKKSKGRRLVLALLFLLFFFLVFLPLLFHFGPFQNFLVNKISDKISNDTGSKITIEGVDFSVFSGLILEDFYVSSPDSEGDTLVYVGEFSSTFRDNILSFIRKEIAFSELYLKDAVINIKTSENDTISNLKKFVAGLNQSDPQRRDNDDSFLLDLSIIHFDNFRYLGTDENTQKETEVKIRRGELDIEKILMNEDSISIRKLYVTNPYVRLKESVNSDDEAREDIENEEVATTKENIEIILPVGLSIDDLRVNSGHFVLDKGDRPVDLSDDVLDYDHLDLSDIDIDANNLSVGKPFSVEAKINSLNVVASDNFEIKDLGVNSFSVSNRGLVLSDFSLETTGSSVKNYLEFDYDHFGDFSQFAKKIRIVSDMRNSQIALKDISFFFSDLKQNAFFRQNRNRSLMLSGIVNGTIDNLEAEQIRLAVDDKITLEGSISAANFTDPKKALINMYIDELSSSMTNLKSVIPGFDPPAQFFKLDPIRFSGDIEGFFNDFVVYGALESALGKARLDTRLDTKEGVENARYSGELALQDFDLAAWTDNPDFGNTTLSARIIDGFGLSIDNLNTELESELQAFQYKGYDYKNISLNGLFEKNQFDGTFIANDPNFTADFDGKIDIQDKAFSSVFEANIENLNLKNLNLSNDVSEIKGRLDLSLNGSSITDFEGTALIENLALNFKEKNFDFDSLYLTSSPTDANRRNIVLDSDFLSAALDGQFDLAVLDDSFKSILVDNYPGWAEYLNIKKGRAITTNQDFTYRLNIIDTEDYLELLSIYDLQLQGVDIEGYYKSQSEAAYSNIKVNEILYKDNLGIDSLRLNLSLVEDETRMSIDADQVISGLKYRDPLSISTVANGDVIDLRIETSNLLDSLAYLAFNTEIRPDGNNIRMHLDHNDIKMFGTQWQIGGQNDILIGSGEFDIKNLLLTDGLRKIVVEGNQEELRVDFKKLDFLLLNGIIDYDKIRFAGEGDMQLSVQSVMDKPRVNLDMIVPTLTLNDVDYGKLTASVSDRNDGQVDIILRIDKPADDMLVKVEGEITKENKAVEGKVTVRNLGMEIFEFIIDDGISRTSGDAVIDARVFGSLDDIKIDGIATINDGYTQVDYLSNYLKLGSQPITITDKFIDFSLVTLEDRLGNVATMEGGLNHDFFGDFSSDLLMSSDNFLALDTDKYDNSTYYGTGIGEMTVSFSGPFHSTDIEVDAISKTGTVLNIPIEDSYDNYNESFIKFVNRDTINQSNLDSTLVEGVKLEGVDIEMNLTVTPDADVNIIFNEATNDVIRGKGEGDLRVVVSREGDFNVFGDYEVYDGEYLFRAWGVVTKPFAVKRGGLITWTGDPINANLNIEADYEDVRVPTNIFLAEYIESGNAQLKAEARKRTDVDLTMKLTGTLYNPIINFDIDFPELQGELKTFTDAKMRTLYENEADLNEQVAGLILFRSFLPANSFGNVVATGRGVVETGYNTLSEFISNQLSYMLSGILQEALKENGFISGIDFEIGISKNATLLDGLDNTNNINYLPDEVEVSLKPRFQNDKWGFDYGTSFVNTKNSNRGTYLIHDFALEYFLTDDRRLKLRVYGKWDRDQVQFQNEQKYGVGLNYRKEFGNLVDFKKALSQDIGKLKSDKVSN